MRGRRDQACGGRRREQQRHEVDGALERRDVGEALLERHDEQEGEQHLNARKRDPQLLEELLEIAVEPLLLALVAGAFAVLHRCVHAEKESPPAALAASGPPRRYFDRDLDEADFLRVDPAREPPALVFRAELARERDELDFDRDDELLDRERDEALLERPFDELLELLEDRRLLELRRAPPLRSAAGISSRATAFASCSICFSRNFAIRSSSRRMPRASFAVSLSPTVSASDSMPA